MKLQHKRIASLTLAGFVACGASPPKQAAPPSKSRADIASAGVDYMPIGSSRAVDKARAIQRQR